MEPGRDPNAQAAPPDAASDGEARPSHVPGVHGAHASDPKPPPLRQRIAASPVTFALAAINIAVFFWVESKGSSTDTGTLLRFGAVEESHVLAGEVWRVLTPMFLHIGFVHLAWNTYASFGFCTVVESVLGRLRFLGVYLVSGIAGAAASALLLHAVGAGASGAMFGIIGATFAIRWRILGSIAALAKDRYARSMLGNIAMWTLIGAVALNIDHAAHFGGLVFGALGGAAATSRRRALPWAVLVAMTAALVAAAARPGAMPGPQTSARAMAFSAMWATGGKHGFVKDVPRAVRLAELACRAPDTSACVATAQAMAAEADATLAERGRALLHRACAAGSADACQAERAPVEPPTSAPLDLPDAPE